MNRATWWWVGGGVLVGLIVLALVYGLILAPGRTAEPSPSPARTPIVASASMTPSAGQTPSVSRTPTASASLRPPATAAPATLGSLPAGFKLLHEGQPASGDITAWEPAPWGFGCPNDPHTFKSFASLTASRNIQAEGPEWGATETVLVFANETAASAFVTELRTAHESCDGAALESDRRVRTASAAFSGAWDAGYGLTLWEESSTDGGKTWVESPGGAIDLVVRRGRSVALSSQGGEILGDAMQRPDIVAETRQAIDHAAPLLCSFTAKGC